MNRTGIKIPFWERAADQPDPEGYRAPLPVRERIRLATKASAVAFGYVLFHVRSADGTHEGAAAVAGIGLATVVIGALELWWLRSAPDSERIFTRTRTQAAALQAGGTALGIGMLALAFYLGA